jgi:hypothetical protein
MPAECPPPGPWHPALPFVEREALSDRQGKKKEEVLVALLCYVPSSIPHGPWTKLGVSTVNGMYTTFITHGDEEPPGSRTSLESHPRRWP